MGRRCRPIRPKLAIHPYKFALLALEILQDLDIHRTGQWEDPDRLQLSAGAVNTLHRAAEKYLRAVFAEAKFRSSFDRRRHGDVWLEDVHLARRFGVFVKLA